MGTQKTIISISLCVAMLACSKQKPVECGPPQQEVDPLFKQFCFKPGSFWVFKNSDGSITDTIRIVRNDGIRVDTIGPDGHVQPCTNYIESFYEEFSHHLFSDSVASIKIGTQNGWFRFFKNPNIVIFKGKAGDSVAFDGIHTTTISKIEDIHPALTVKDETFTNVFQMRYSPEAAGFQRIWWCPTAGFVKLEFRNIKTNAIEQWELVSKSAQVF